MSQKVELLFFDINNIVDEDDEDENEDNNKNNNEEIKENNINPKKDTTLPQKFIEHFLDNNILIDLEKEDNEYFNSYSFIYQIEKGITKQCKFYLFNTLYQKSFTIDSNGLFVFCELNNMKSKNSLEKLIEYIKKTCSNDIKLFIIGIIYLNKQSVFTKENIDEIFKDEDLKFNYNEITLNIKDKEQINNIDNENNNINNINNIEIINVINNEDNINKENNNINIDNINNINIEKNNEDNNNNELDEVEEETFEKLDKLIEQALYDIYKYQKEKKPTFNKYEEEKEIDQYSSRCKIY